MTFQPAHTNMDSMCVDLSEGDIVDVSDGVLDWLRANQQHTEQMIQRGQTIYNLNEWEIYERWAKNKLDAVWQEKGETERRMQTLQRELQTMQVKLERMQTEQTDLLGKIGRLEQGAETFSSVHTDYAQGMIAIEALVTRATDQTRDHPPLLPITGDERIIDRLNALVERMAQMEKMKEEERRGRDHWDPETSVLASQEMHDLLHSR